MHYQPDRGHFINLNFDPRSGTEQGGERPALVLSSAAFNISTGLAFVCPISNQVKGGAFEVRVPTGCKVTGVVLCDQLRSLDWISREARQWGIAPIQLVDDVLAHINAILAIRLE